jgi:hypothetical protein
MKLKQEIEVWKKRLVDAEKANGVLQVLFWTMSHSLRVYKQFSLTLKVSSLSCASKESANVPEAIAAPVVPAPEVAQPVKVEKKKKPAAEKAPPAEEEPIHVGRYF